MNRHDLRKNLIGIALMSATALGCMIADILWTERGSALFYALFALGCLLFGILVFIFLREVLPVLLLLDRVNMQNNPDILAQIVAKAPRKEACSAMSSTWSCSCICTKKRNTNWRR